MMGRYREALSAVDPVVRIGYVRQLAGLCVQADGPDALIGEVCEIEPLHGGAALRAEVIGLHEGRTVLMPFGKVDGVGANCRVTASGLMPQVAVGQALLGRVVDAFGAALDGRALPPLPARRAIRAEPLNPMRRPRIDTVLETGVRSIDSMLTIGHGQRVGIFAGSGVGKSTLLGMIARHARADVNVIALIGERGREVRDFIDKHLGPEGMARSVVVVATADQPALARARAAYAATAMAEYFRDQGRHVMLTMDSVTRFAMARREIGLSAGEPPTARGYTPSVFAELPALCERCGTAESGGSITALFTVLVEGDDFNEPISDMLRATLDGHIMLSRQLAQQGHYPAVDVLQSASRLFSDLASRAEQKLARRAFEMMALYQRNRQMVDIGAYRAGSNAEIDAALAAMPLIERFLRQDECEPVARRAALAELATIFSEKEQA